jgi:cytochrome c553
MKLSAVLIFLLPLLAAAAPGRSELAQALESPPDARRGAELYGQCASCHGADGAGVTEGSTPRIAGQHYQVLIKQLADFRSGRRRDFRMEELANRHHLAGPRDIADVAAYVSGLESAGVRGIGDGTRATSGALLFGARCASCHGADGRGDPARFVPRLAGQHYSYLVRQMYDAVDGRRPTLVDIHARRIEPLDYDQVRGIADYLSRIAPPAPLPVP